jgi:uncharacterized repeat protein (TIGR01451 family)
MTCNKTFLLMTAICLVVVAALPASAQSNVSDLYIQAFVNPNPALPGSTLHYFVQVQNLGPNVGLDPAVITGTLPAGVTATSCFARLYGPFRIIDGTCVIAGQSITATVPASIFPYATFSEQYFLFFDAVLTPSAPNGGAVFSSTFSVSGASRDPNLANNSTAVVFTTPAPLSITVSPKQLSFGIVALNHDSSRLTISATNSGKSGFSYTPALTGDFVEADNSCTGSHLRGVTTSAFVTPGTTCVSTLIFQPTGLGPATGTITFSEQDDVGQSAQQVVKLGGVGSNIALQPQSFTFSQIQMDGTSSDVGLTLINVGSTPVPIGAIQTSSSFSQTNDCGGVAQAQSQCNIFVSFTPTVAGLISGTLTVPVPSLPSPLVATLQGTGSAVKLTPSPRMLDLGSVDLGARSDPLPVTLTNVSTEPLRLNGVSVSGTGFHEKDDCPHRLHPGESCTISTSFRATIDEGPEQGSLIVDTQDPVGPQTFQLAGTGIGIRHNTVLLHYDYMVAADHTHDPEVAAPGAIQAVVDAFARHGIRMIVDPQHTAIPETDVTVFGPADCSEFLSGNFGLHSANFYDLKSQYFHSSNPRVHYSIFGHYIAIGDPENSRRCDPFSFSGLSELPGQNFVNSQIGGFLLPEDAFTPSMARTALASAYMHEFGHNLGLHHGGGLGPIGTDNDDFERNFKPNYISVMNYNYLGVGIPQGDAVGSTNLKACTLDTDCGDALCTDTAFAAPEPAKACFRVDYSRQTLPTGGNTPGFLDENGNLDEVAGLGSGNADVITLIDNDCHGDLAPSNGPLDWDRDGSATNTHATADVIPIWWLSIQRSSGCPSSIYTKLGGFDDWAALTDKVDDVETQNSLNTSSPRDHAREVDLPTLKDKHLLYPLRQASIVIHPGCSLASAPLAPGQPGTVTVAILGSASFDVTQIDLTSLHLHGVTPLSTSVGDVNADGFPDLVATFDSAQLHLNPRATTVRLNGWMNNSQRFSASAPITIVNDMNTQPAECRN